MSPKHLYLQENDIPEWIRGSPYLQSLQENGPFPERGLKVPKWCLKRDTTINCQNDAIRFLRTARYWLLPDEVVTESKALLRYCFCSIKVVDRFNALWTLKQENPLLEGIYEVGWVSKNSKITRAIQVGARSVLKFLCEDLHFEIPVNAPNVAVREDQLECLKYLHSRGLTLTNNVLVEYAALYGSVLCLKYLHENGAPMTDTALLYAMYIYNAKSIACLTFILENHHIANVSTSLLISRCKQCALENHFETAKLMAEWFPVSSMHNAIMSGAAEGGHLPILQFIVDREIHRTQETDLLNKSARGGHFECLEYLHGLGYPFNASTMEAAAVSGDMRCIDYLLARDCPTNATVCSILTEHDHLTCLGYVRVRNVAWDARTCAGAARIGSIQCLMFAHQNGCPWDTQTSIAAAGAGNLNCLQYAHTHGCPWDERTCEAAARGGHLACLKYAHENGCPWKKKGKTCDEKCEWISVSAARAPSADCLQYVLERGACVRKATAVRAAEAKSVASLQLLCARKCPWDASASAAAAGAGALECLHFLHENGCPWDKSAAFAITPAGEWKSRNSWYTWYMIKHRCDWSVAYESHEYMRLCYDYLKKHKCPGIS